MTDDLTDALNPAPLNTISKVRFSFGQQEWRPISTLQGRRPLNDLWGQRTFSANLI